jgi:hypothetical protein
LGKGRGRGHGWRRVAERLGSCPHNLARALWAGVAMGGRLMDCHTGRMASEAWQVM